LALERRAVVPGIEGPGRSPRGPLPYRAEEKPQVGGRESNAGKEAFREGKIFLQIDGIEFVEEKKKVFGEPWGAGSSGRKSACIEALSEGKKIADCRWNNPRSILARREPGKIISI